MKNINYLIIKTWPERTRVAICLDKVQSCYINSDGFTHILMDCGLIYKTNIKFDDLLTELNYKEPW